MIRVKLRIKQNNRKSQPNQTKVTNQAEVANTKGNVKNLNVKKL